MDILDQIQSYASKGYNTYTSYVYVLKLEQEKYWVGETKNYIQRILLHTNNLPSKNTTEWTKLYKPISIIEIVEKDLERDKTLEYMKLYGWQKRRSQETGNMGYKH